MPSKALAKLMLRAGALLLLLPSACFRNEAPRKADWDFNKDGGASEACVDSNLSQLGFNGPFVHKLLRCASNRRSDGSSSLAATERLLTSLRPEQLQRLIDFLLLVDPHATNHEERYPYLVAFSTLLDRDLLRAPDDRPGRLGDLQEFLLSLETARTRHVLTQWSHSGRLESILSELGQMLEGLDDHSLSALTQELLAGQSLRDPFLKVLRPLLQDEPLMGSLEAALSAEETREPKASVKEDLIDLWRQPRSLSPVSDLSADASDAARTPAQHLEAFAGKWTAEEWKGVSAALETLWNAYRRHDPDIQAGIDRRLIAVSEHSIDQQQNPSLWLLSLAHDLGQRKAKDFKDISQALERLLGTDYDATLDSLRAKVGSSRIMELLERQLVRGGEVPGCSGYAIAGLGDATDFRGFASIMQELSTPRAACGDQTPLQAALDAWTKREGCVDCLPRRTRDPEQVASYWAGSNDLPPPSLLRDLVQSTLSQVATDLKRDPFALKNRGLAAQAVAPEIIESLARQLQASPIEDVRDLAAFDLALTDSKRGVLSRDFLERILATQLEELASLSGQFHDLVPENDATASEEKPIDQRASRIFAGIYNQGPIERALAERLRPEVLYRELRQGGQSALKTFFETDPAATSWFLARLRSSESSFRYPEFAVQNGEDATPFASLGSSLQNIVSFNADPVLPRMAIRAGKDLLQPTQAIQSFDPYDRSRAFAWGLWAQQLGSSSLLSKDMPPDLARDFENWSRDGWQNFLSDPQQWQDLVQREEPAWSRNAGALPTRFFDVEPYKPEEARILSLYYIRHYLKPEPILPDAIRLATEPLPTPSSTTFSKPLPAFMNASYMTTPGSEYRLFAKLFPVPLRDGAITTLDALGSRLLPPLHEIAATDGPGFLPYRRQNLIRDVGRLDASSFTPTLRLLSTFNLLSFTRAGTAYYPQPLIGFGGDLCHSSESESRSCPVEFAETDPKTAYAQYQAYMQRVLQQHFCPMLAGDDLGPRTLWQERLGLRFEDPSLCASAASLASLSADPIRFPPWLSRWILSDIFAMGKHARLKPGLVQVPAAMRFYKLRDVRADLRAEQWLRESLGVWSQANAASQKRRQAYASSFWAGPPSLLASLVDARRQELDAAAWKQALSSLAAKGAESGDDDQLRDLLQSLLQIQNEVAASDGSALEVLLRWLDSFTAHPERARMLAYLLSDYSSLESYDFVGNDLPLAILGLFEDRFSWQDPALRLMKFAAQRETLQSWSEASRIFSPEESLAFIGALTRASAALAPLSERSTILEQGLSDLVSLGQLWQPARSSFLAEHWDAALKRWRALSWGQGYGDAWRRLLAAWDSPLARLDGKVGPSPGQMFHGAPLLAHAPRLLALHQAAAAEGESLFWPRLIDGFLDGIERYPKGTQALAHWLGSPSIAWDQPGRWSRLLEDNDARRTFAAAWDALAEVPARLWRDAALESTRLLDGLQKPLAYLETHIRWHEDPERNAFKVALGRLSFLAHDPELNEKQGAWLKAWLKGDDEPGTASN